MPRPRDDAKRERMLLWLPQGEGHRKLTAYPMMWLLLSLLLQAPLKYS